MANALELLRLRVCVVITTSNRASVAAASLRWLKVSAPSAALHAALPPRERTCHVHHERGATSSPERKQ